MTSDYPLDHGKRGVQPIGTVKPYPPRPIPPRVDKGAWVHSLVGCHVCKRGYLLEEMTAHLVDDAIAHYCPDCEAALHDEDDE